MHTLQGVLTLQSTGTANTRNRVASIIRQHTTPDIVTAQIDAS